MGVSKDTVSRWRDRAAEHVEEVSRELMKKLNLTQVQIDELWSFIQKKRKT
jgi:ribosomal protein L31E